MAGIAIGGTDGRGLGEEAVAPRIEVPLSWPWRTQTIAVAVTLMAASFVLAALPHDHFGFHHLAARTVVDTASGIAAVAAAWLMRARFKQTESAMSWLLMAGLGCYALTALMAFSLPGVLDLDQIDAAGVPILGRLFAGSLLAAASFAGTERLRRPPSTAASLDFVLGLTATCVLVGTVLADRFPQVLIGRFDENTIGIGHASSLFIGVTAATAALYMLAGAMLWIRARAVEDRTVGWLGIGALLVGCSRIDALILASASPSLVTVSDFVRLLSVCAFVAASAAEFRRFEQRLTDAVAADERRRLARELHDGLAQDLAYVSSQASALARRGGDPAVLREIALVTERALSDSRRAIHLLNRPRSRALSAALAERAYELCERFGVELEFSKVGDEVHATPEVEHALLQIVSEAISNAERHGQAQTICVQLMSRGGEFSVRVSDDGCGFRPDAVRPRRRFSGFGLTSMAERAHALGGDVAIDSRPGCGTTVEATFR
jgi:signal transduction histidine kinase